MRFKALEAVQSRPKERLNTDTYIASEHYCKYVFTLKTMRKYLAKDTFKAVQHAISTGEKIGRDIADDVSTAMKTWAMEHGATHYTHWFQPLTGSTAEKHDSFFELRDGEALEVFPGSALVQQEPDASSFPSGGIRSTFEARGYTAWDPSSPAFIIKLQSGLTLCIPTIFISYTGEALDYKAPLLKAIHLLEKVAVKVCRHFDGNVNKAAATLGIEQEYFLIDEALYQARPDLVLANRTLIGRGPAKGQQLEDHYFGTIPERVHSFMVQLEREAIELGIPLRTRHNEVAPSQFECAPQFEEVNTAVDHNQLLMDIMDKIASHHKLKVLLHEKPFAGVNGSGKHCNWSIGTDNGINLLSPGTTPEQNLLFLTFFINTIKAVHRFAPLLRASIASASNDHRLGANEAPPAIISIFIGSRLTHALNQLIEASSSEHPDANKKLEIPNIPEIAFDFTDRNRTSPFAFTGNKFEFRAVGSSANTASSMIALNTAVADQLLAFDRELCAELEKGVEKDQAAMQILKRYILESRDILFEGNNYSEEWAVEAAKRGLGNLPTSPESLDAFISQENIDLFKRNNILTERELIARHEIRLEMYSKQIQIESRILSEMVLSQVVPAAMEYLNDMLITYNQLMDCGLEDQATESKKFVEMISNHINEARKLVMLMIEERKVANKMLDTREVAMHYCHNVKPHFDTIRYHVDKLELYVDDRLWPLPKYRELLFVK